MSQLDRPLVVGLGAAGVGPALVGLLWPNATLAILGVWTALALLLWVPTAVRRAPERPFATLALAGLVAGVVTAALHGGLAHVMVAREPSLGPATGALRAQVAVFAIVVGVAWGALFGGVAYGIARARGRGALGARA